ncbi:MAG: hypothetical protein RR540_09095, partial [Oscillospiraceae bacterium]
PQERLLGTFLPPKTSTAVGSRRAFTLVNLPLETAKTSAARSGNPPSAEGELPAVATAKPSHQRRQTPLTLNGIKKK